MFRDSETRGKLAGNKAMHRSKAESGIPHTSRSGGNCRLRCALTH